MKWVVEIASSREKWWRAGLPPVINQRWVELLPPERFADIPILSNFDQTPKKRSRIILICYTSF